MTGVNAWELWRRGVAHHKASRTRRLHQQQDSVATYFFGQRIAIKPVGPDLEICKQPQTLRRVPRSPGQKCTRGCAGARVASKCALRLPPWLDAVQVSPKTKPWRLVQGGRLASVSYQQHSATLTIRSHRPPSDYTLSEKGGAAGAEVLETRQNRVASGLYE